METICGLGLPEMIIIALLAFVVIGPERSQEVALQTGRFLRNIMRSEWWADFNEITGALRNLPTTLVRMAEIEEAQREIEETMRDINTATGAQPRQPKPPPARPTPTPNAQAVDMTTDPWGIANATAQTEHIEPEGDSMPADEHSDDEPPDEPTPTEEEPSIDDDAAARDH